MKPDIELELRLRELRNHVAHAPSLVDEVMRRVEQTSIAPVSPAPTWRERLMRFANHKHLRWAIPVAVAAAIILVVGIWPQHGKNGKPGGSGRGYVMADVPALLEAARTMHVKLSTYQRDPAQPNKEPIKAEGEMWLDFQTGKKHTSRRDPEAPPELGFQQTVCDGQYVMEEYTAKEARGGYSLGVRFKKLTPYQARLETRQGDFFRQMFGRVDQVTGFAVSGREDLAGQSYNIWEGTIQIAPQPYHLKVWLSPTTGDIGRVQYWDEHADGAPWIMFFDFEQIERDVALADELFSTDPRPGYKAENTKETAPVQVLGTSAGVESVEPYAMHQHIAFRLLDGSILFGWGVYDKGNSDPESLFKNLVPGGELPPLPACPVSLSPVPPQDGLTYTGRHLVYTRLKKDYCVEWTLYVPSLSPSPNSEILSYQCDVEYTADKEQFGCFFDGVNVKLQIDSAAEFNTWVRGAMADLSESGTAPDQVTYEYTLDLCKQIRSELAKGSTPPASR